MSVANACEMVDTGFKVLIVDRSEEQEIIVQKSAVHAMCMNCFLISEVKEGTHVYNMCHDDYTFIFLEKYSCPECRYVYSIMRNIISERISDDETEKKYLQFLSDENKKLLVLLEKYLENNKSEIISTKNETAGNIIDPENLIHLFELENIVEYIENDIAIARSYNDLYFQRIGEINYHIVENLQCLDTNIKKVKNGDEMFGQLISCP